jgi:creatinine amidohydrolase
MRQGFASFEEAGGPQAYFGDPAAATAEEGRQTIEKLGAILAEAVDEALGVPQPNPEAGAPSPPVAGGKGNGGG